MPVFVVQPSVLNEWAGWDHNTGCESWWFPTQGLLERPNVLLGYESSGAQRGPAAVSTGTGLQPCQSRTPPCAQHPLFLVQIPTPIIPRKGDTVRARARTSVALRWSAPRPAAPALQPSSAWCSRSRPCLCWNATHTTKTSFCSGGKAPALHALLTCFLFLKIVKTGNDPKGDLKYTQWFPPPLTCSIQ